jgi:hypothetical protein
MTLPPAAQLADVPDDIRRHEHLPERCEHASAAARLEAAVGEDAPVADLGCGRIAATEKKRHRSS